MGDRDVRVLEALPAVGPTMARSLAGSIGRRGAAPAVLPDRTVMVLRHTQDAERLAAYARVCGFTLRDRVPPTWLHVLTFPLQTWLMGERDFPFPLAGLVHVSNEMTLHRPVGVGEDLRLSVRADQLRPHRRGATYAMVGEIHVADELVWSGRSTYLAPGASVPGDPVDTPRAVGPEAAPSGEWRLPADLGRRYAAVSGDVNPIHLHPVTARAFGFPRPIIHGLWTHARALAALEGRLPEAYRVDVAFTKPILLPATVAFAAEHSGDGYRFAVMNRAGEKTYLIGGTSAP